MHSVYLIKKVKNLYDLISDFNSDKWFEINNSNYSNPFANYFLEELNGFSYNKINYKVTIKKIKKGKAIREIFREEQSSFMIKNLLLLNKLVEIFGKEYVLKDIQIENKNWTSVNSFKFKEITNQYSKELRIMLNKNLVAEINLIELNASKNNLIFDKELEFLLRKNYKLISDFSKIDNNEYFNSGFIHNGYVKV